MSLTHAILGLLRDRPMTGYDLKTQCFDTSISHFWNADQAQIYRTLDKLAEEGLVESYIEYQENRPNRKIYSLTNAGREELARWMQTTQPLVPYREPFLVQLFFADSLPTEQVIAALETQIAKHRERLAVYENVALPPFDHPEMTREHLFQRFTLDLGIRSEQMYIEWLQACIKRLESL